LQNTSYSALADFLHDIPHRNLIQVPPWPLLVPTATSITDDPIEWVQSCGFVPATMIVAGLIFALVLYIYLCCKRCKFKPITLNRKKPNVCYLISLSILSLLTIGAIATFTTYQFFLRDDATNLLNTVDTLDAYKETVVSDVEGVRDVTGVELDLINFIVENSTDVPMPSEMREDLNNAANITQDAYDFLVDAAEMVDVDIPLEQVHDGADLGLYYHLIVISCVSALPVIFFVVMFAITFGPRQPNIPCQYCMDVSATSFFALVWLVACALFVTTIAMGDVCHIAPTAFIDELVDSDIVDYYWDCADGAVNPVDGNIDSAYDLLVDVQVIVDDFRDIAANYTNLYNTAVDLSSNITHTLELLNATKEHIACDTIHGQVVYVTNLLCLNLMPNLFYTFVGMGSMGLLLPITFCLMARKTVADRKRATKKEKKRLLADSAKTSI